MSPSATPAPDTDRQLQIRIALALALVVVMPFALVYTFLFVANTVGPFALSIHPGIVAAVVAAGLLLQYRFGPRLVVSSVAPDDGEEDTDASADVEATVARLASQVDLPAPVVDVIDGRMPNAFAVGTPGTAHVVVTTGLLDVLDGDELEAVLAHEVAHIKNRDASIMTIAWVIPTITYYLTMAAAGVLSSLGRAMVPGSSRRRPTSQSHFAESRAAYAGGGSPSGGVPVIARIPPIIALALMTIVTMAISTVFWLASVALYGVLATYREYAADRGAATITGSPAALASALRSLDDEIADVPDEDLRRFDGGAEALYIAPLDPSVFEDRSLLSASIFPATHPPTDQRIQRLRDLAATAA